MRKAASTFLILSLMIALSQSAAADDKADRAQQIIKQARASMGGEKFASIKSLSAAGSYRRSMGERELSGDLEFDMIFPDKFLKTETFSPVPGMDITRFDAINGDRAWMDSKQSGGGGGMVVIRRPGGDTPQGQAMQQQSIQADFARLLLGWLLTTQSSFPVEFSYLGEAEAPDGRADAIEVKGPAGFNARFFLDQKTHRPLMLTYRGRQPRMQVNQVGGPASSHEEIEKKIKEAEAAMAASPEVEFQINFSDYREVDGVHLPHRLTKSIERQVNEEWEIKKFKLNPSIKPEKFEKK
ncbi:MAG: hypothetical protein AB1631_01570 [Acidobacteriota bacterium]